MKHRKDGCIGADPERERDDDGEREPRASCQGAEGVAEIVQSRAHGAHCI